MNNLFSQKNSMQNLLFCWRYIPQLRCQLFAVSNATSQGDFKKRKQFIEGINSYPRTTGKKIKNQTKIHFIEFKKMRKVSIPVLNPVHLRHIQVCMCTRMMRVCYYTQRSRGIFEELFCISLSVEKINK